MATEGMVGKAVGLAEGAMGAEAEVVGLAEEEEGGDWVNISDIKNKVTN
jgi:hypothetical protein